MGAKQSTATELDYYVIRLRPEQSTTLYGYMKAKTTLTWRDVMDNAEINVRACVRVGLPSNKLCRMQPDIREWIRWGKARLEDCAVMQEWKPNVFNHFGCCIGDLVVHRQVILPRVVIEGGDSFDILKDKYGLTPELMALLKYSAQDWLDLRIGHEFLTGLTNEQWTRIFGTTHNRAEMIEMARRQANGLSSGAQARQGLQNDANG
jgi:hypothetical protein